MAIFLFHDLASVRSYLLRAGDSGVDTIVDSDGSGQIKVIGSDGSTTLLISGAGVTARVKNFTSGSLGITLPDAPAAEPAPAPVAATYDLGTSEGKAAWRSGSANPELGYHLSNAVQPRPGDIIRGPNDGLFRDVSINTKIRLQEGFFPVPDMDKRRILFGDKNDNALSGGANSNRRYGGGGDLGNSTPNSNDAHWRIAA